MKNKKRKFTVQKIAAVAALAVILQVGALSAVYAADVGGFREVVNVWLHGESTEAIVEQIGDGEYKVSYGDTESEDFYYKGSTIVQDEDGTTTEKPVSGDQFTKDFSEHADVEETDDGRVMVYYYDQSIDITDQFDEDGVCRLELTHDEETQYLTIKRMAEGSYSWSQSNEGYPNVD